MVAVSVTFQYLKVVGDYNLLPHVNTSLSFNIMELKKGLFRVICMHFLFFISRNDASCIFLKYSMLTVIHFRYLLQEHRLNSKLLALQTYM
jgi:hypothetical protein